MTWGVLWVVETTTEVGHPYVVRLNTTKVRKAERKRKPSIAGVIV